MDFLYIHILETRHWEIHHHKRDTNIAGTITNTKIYNIFTLYLAHFYPHWYQELLIIIFRHKI